MLATLESCKSERCQPRDKSLKVQFYDPNELIQAQATAKAGLLLFPVLANCSSFFPHAGTDPNFTS